MGIRGFMQGRVVFLMASFVMILSSTQAVAHSFNLILVAPVTGSNAAAGGSAVDGFMLATREEDAHPLEESDGHLGGLDSYVYTLNTQSDPMKMQASLQELLDNRQPVFISGSFDLDIAGLLASSVTGKNVVLFNPIDSQLWRLNKNAPAKMKMIDGTPFASGFEKTYGYMPDSHAFRAYVAARLIAMAVRSLEGEPADDIDDTRAALLDASKSS